MNPASLISALVGAQTGMLQLAVAARLERMNADNAGSVVKLIDAAQQSANALPMPQAASAPISTLRLSPNNLRQFGGSRRGTDIPQISHCCRDMLLVIRLVIRLLIQLVIPASAAAAMHVGNG